MRAACSLFLGLIVLTLVGCGSDYKLVPVSGTALLDGEPIPEAIVMLQPIGSDENATPGPGSFGKTDQNGKFTLALQNEDRDGAVVGEHRVLIKQNKRADKASSDDTVDRNDRDTLPPSCRDGSMQITIPPEGETDLVIEVKS